MLFQSLNSYAEESSDSFSVTDSTISEGRRVKLILEQVDVIKLLFNLAQVSYKKSCLLRRKRKKNNLQASNVNNANSNGGGQKKLVIPVVEEHCYSSDSSDSNSEPLLGKWFEETLQVIN